VSQKQTTHGTYAFTPYHVRSPIKKTYHVRPFVYNLVYSC